LFVVAVTLRDVFQVVIVPRAASSALRISRFVSRYTWRVWPRLAYRLYAGSESKREDLLATYAPFNLVLVLVAWVAGLIIGWGLFFYGIREQLHPGGLTFAACVYYAGASLLTIGYGDIVATTTFARVMSLIAAVSGLGTVAVVTSFLFATFGAFQVREQFVVTLASRAGLPPSGLGLLLVHAQTGLREDLAQVLRDGQAWTAHVMETHLAYPMLMYFRSSHDYESWVGTLGALLDASALILSSFDDGPVKTPLHGQALIMYYIGRHLTHDFASYYNLEEDSLPVTGAGIDRSEFDSAYTVLQQAGYALNDCEYAWAEFSRFRSTYALHLNELARWLEIPPIQWVGDRSLIRVH
jgi:Ion channel